MKTAIISDLHGNLAAATAVFADIRRRMIRDVVCLGDMIGYGPNPREVLDMCRDCRFVLMGNHEEAVMFYGEDFNEKARQALEWTKEQLNSTKYDRTENYELWNFLGSLEEKHIDDGMYYVHGSPRVPTKEYMVPGDIRNREKMTEIFEMISSLCFVGHSHIPGVYTDSMRFYSPDRLGGSYTHKEGKALINVGSVGQPRDGDPRCSYVTTDGKTVTFHRLEYDVEDTVKKIYATPGLPNYLADRLLVGR
jgi:diadenosine tetraphosphatase ApaH/serine/threonine PP2A family protein phosphatase